VPKSNTLAAQPHALARGIQQVSGVNHSPTAEALAQHQLTPPIACPRCGAIDQPGAHRFDPVLSALVDHLLMIEGELAEVKRLVEEVVS
jgi:hypothetical protein